MKMIGKFRAKTCRYGCCSDDMRDGKKNVTRRQKRREDRQFKKETLKEVQP